MLFKGENLSQMCISMRGEELGRKVRAVFFHRFVNEAISVF